MSAIPAWIIHCDGCGEPDGGDLGARTAGEARERIRVADGWSVGAPGGTDWCPECRENGTMRAGLQRHYMRRRFRR